MSNLLPRVIFYGNDRSEVSWGWKVGHEGRPPIGEYLSVEEAAAREREAEKKAERYRAALKRIVAEEDPYNDWEEEAMRMYYIAIEALAGGEAAYSPFDQVECPKCGAHDEARKLMLQKIRGNLQCISCSAREDLVREEDKGDAT